MPRVVHFEVGADDPERAAKFYKDVFDWKVEKWNGNGMDYLLVNTGPDKKPGINGGIFKREKPLSRTEDLKAYRCTIDVSEYDMDEYLIKIATSGGQIIQPKTPISGIGWLAFCKDTEGNIFGIMKNNPAKIG